MLDFKTPVHTFAPVLEIHLKGQFHPDQATLQQPTRGAWMGILR